MTRDKSDLILSLLVLMRNLLIKIMKNVLDSARAHSFLVLSECSASSSLEWLCLFPNNSTTKKENNGSYFSGGAAAKSFTVPFAALASCNVN